jgi:hypothetical protein
MLNSGFTTVPNYFLDHIAHTLSGAELKVMLYVYRHTLGYGKLLDKISYSQFTSGIVRKDGTRVDNGAGISRRSLVDALTSLEAHGLIKRAGKQGCTCQVALTDLACGNVDKHFTDSTKKVQELPPAHGSSVQKFHPTKDNYLQDKIISSPLLTNEQSRLIDTITERIPDMPKSQAVTLVKRAYSQRTQASVWLYALLEYVLSAKNVRSPVAAFTAFVQRNITPNAHVGYGSGNDSALQQQYRPGARVTIDYSRYLPGGKYQHVASAGNNV